MVGHRKKGFTLVEVMVIIAVIVILATISIVAYNSVQDRAHTAATLSNVRAYVNALEILEIREGIYSGSGCIGGSTDEACSTMGLVGGSCPADLEVNYSVERNYEFDNKIRQIMGSLPESVISDPYVVHLQLAEDCYLEQVQSTAKYQSYKALRVEPDGDVMFTYTSDRPKNNQAWSITFKLNDKNATCPLPNSYDITSNEYKDQFTSCAIIGGNVTYE